MTFDIIEITEEELKNYSAVQMQLLRTAQKNKNKLRRNLEKEMEMFEQIVLTDDVYNSSLVAQKRAALEAEFDYEVEILVEQLLYSLELNSPTAGDDENYEDVGYIVDYSLSYAERYNIVKNYYLSIEDPSERMALYAADEVAKKYLSSYYVPLYNTLSTYSK